MRIATLTVASTLVLACLLAGGAALAQPAGPATPLFNGRDLDGWEIVNGGRFTVEDGLLRVNRGTGWLRSRDTFGDFVLTMEFRFLEPGAMSGIFVRTAATSNDDENGWPNQGYQVQCMDTVSGDFPLGQLMPYGAPPFEHEFDAEALQRAYRPAGEWHTYEITARGENLWVRLNGELITTGTRIEQLTGHIGIQAEHGLLEFRRIEVATQEAERSAAADWPDLQPRPGRHALLAPHADHPRQRRRAARGLVVPLSSRRPPGHRPGPDRRLPAGHPHRRRRRDVPWRRATAVVALRPETGEELWRHQLSEGLVSYRGVTYWPGSGEHGARIFFTSLWKVIALDAATGARDPQFGNGRRSRAARALRRRAGGLARHPGARLQRLRSRGDTPRAAPRPAPRRGRAALRLPARARREDGPAALGVPDDAARDRLRQPHVGQQQLARPHRQQRVGGDADRRRGARARLPARQRAGVELLRRRPAGRQPVRQHDDRGRHRDRRARVALPEHPPRAVGTTTCRPRPGCSRSSGTGRRFRPWRRWARRRTCSS